ncbi:uncharacterized protein METZ01_LOCUS264351, partial [marine metagenome]
MKHSATVGPTAMTPWLAISNKLRLPSFA